MDFVEEDLFENLDLNTLHNLIPTLECDIGDEFISQYLHNNTVSGIQNAISTLDINKEIFTELNDHDDAVLSNFLPRLEQNYDNNHVTTRKEFNKVINDSDFVFSENQFEPNVIEKSLSTDGGHVLPLNFLLYPPQQTFTQSSINNSIVNTPLQRSSFKIPGTLYIHAEFLPDNLERIKECVNYLRDVITWAIDNFYYEEVMPIIQEYIDAETNSKDFCDKLRKRFCHLPVYSDNALKNIELVRMTLLQKKIFIEGIRPPPNYHQDSRYLGSELNSEQIQTSPNIQVQTALFKNSASIIIDSIMSPSLHNANCSVERIDNSEQMQIATNISVEPTDSTILQNSKSNIAKKEVDHKWPISTTLPSSSNINIDGCVLEEQLQESNLMLQSPLTIIEDEKETTIENNINKSPVTEFNQCQEKSFLNVKCLLQRIKSKLSTNGLKKFDNTVVQIISQACEQTMTRLLIELLVITEHRLRLLNRTENCEETSDPNAQLRFLEKFEKSKYERQKKIASLVESKTENCETKICNSKQFGIKTSGRRMMYFVGTNEQFYKNSVDMACSLIREKKNQDKKLTETNTWACSKNVPLKSRFKKATIQDLRNLCQADLELRSTKMDKLLNLK